MRPSHRSFTEAPPNKNICSRLFRPKRKQKPRTGPTKLNKETVITHGIETFQIARSTNQFETEKDNPTNPSPPAPRALCVNCRRQTGLTKNSDRLLNYNLRASR